MEPSITTWRMGGTPYKAAGFFMLRTPMLPAVHLLNIFSSEQTGEAPWNEGVLSEIRSLLRTPRVLQALHAASPSLTTAAARCLHSEQPVLDAKTIRIAASVLRYLSRMTTRPTPFGLFAAVGMGEFASTSSLRLDADPLAKTRTRASLSWTLALLEEAERTVELHDETLLTVNTMLQDVGNHAVLPYRDVFGAQDNHGVRINLTPVVKLILTSCTAGSGARCGEIVKQVTAAFPMLTPPSVMSLMRRLMDARVLTAHRCPPLTWAYPDRHRVLNDEPSRRDELRAVRERCREIDAAHGQAPVPVLNDLVKRQRRLTPAHQRIGYQTDSNLALVATKLTTDVAAAAEEAAGLLGSLQGGRDRPSHIAAYHRAFLERYGVGAEIPVMELLSPHLGLDAPESYQYPPRRHPLPAEHRSGPGHQRREEALTGLLLETIHSGGTTLELTDDRMELLRRKDAGPSMARARPAVDLYFQLCARSMEALDQGEWTMVLSPMPVTAGARGFGRFWDLLGADALAMVRAVARAEEKLLPGVLFAELNYVPANRHAGNVSLHPLIRAHEICVNTAPGLPAAAQIHLDDILVGAMTDRFYLRSSRSNEELLVTQSHLMSPSYAPNVCRLLLELSEDGYPPLSPFSWGGLAASPFLPRVRRGPLVLHPRQWTLPDESAEWREGDDRLSAWCHRWKVPRHVYLAAGDNRLALDLAQPACRAEVNARLRRAERVTLQEMMPGFSQLWLEDTRSRRYFSEFVVPLVAREPGQVRRSPAPRVGLALPPVTSGDRVQAPGGRWLYLKLYAGQSQHNDIITGPIRELIDTFRARGRIDRWFYVRYVDSRPHLRLRLRSSDQRADEGLTVECLSWARHLWQEKIFSDFALAGYDREIERYGGPAAIDVIEELFTASSETSQRILATLKQLDIEAGNEIVCVAILHDLYRNWGMQPRPHALLPPASKISNEARRLFHRNHRLLCDLLEPWDAHPDATARKLRSHLVPALGESAQVIEGAGTKIRRLAGLERLHGTEEDILQSLTHMQVNRILGVDRDQEELCYSLWLMTLRAIEAQPRPVGWPCSARS
ncbi:lantibiotic dehydratase [Nonomuraea insulae]|uniref:Lantibiotic dehydratase n=1 Tax=Nonomuraea insulae TaxID=1616787 RepID=A0ABW1CIE4_9ACTN